MAREAFGASSSRSSSLPAPARNVSSSVIPATSGTRLRPHCSQAAITTLRQCSTRRSARSLDSLTTERSLAIGTILATPSSVDFCRVISMRSPLDTHCASAIARGDSRSTGCLEITWACVLPREPRVSSAVHSPPSPLNRITVSPRRRRSTAQCRATRSGSSISVPGESFTGAKNRGATRFAMCFMLRF